MVPYRVNFDTFVDLNGFLDYLRFCKINNIPFSEDVRCDIDDLRSVLDDLPFGSAGSTHAKDLFIESLAQLNDSGDIDVLVRHLSWQQQDISFLCSQLANYERNLLKLDDSLREIVKLKKNVKQLRSRNAELNNIIKQLKTRSYEKKI